MKKVSSSESIKLAFIGLLLALCVLATYWFHFVEKTDVLFTHFFYLPIILASLWWTYKGVSVALFLALLLPITHILSGLDAPIWEALVRSSFFLVIGITVAALSEKRKNLEEGLRAYSRTLEDRVERRTEELSVRNEELEAFAHTVSHDLQGSLSVIDGFSQVALESIASGDEALERESLDHIAATTRRMNGFINSLLQYASAGRPGGEASRVDIKEELVEVLADFEGDIRNKEAEVFIEEELAVILVDPVKLRQVLLNLIGNALKYMGDTQEPRIEIGATEEDGEVTVRISDNGMGIPPDKQGAIFEAFTRLGSEGPPGLGIGLSTVKRAVEAWGGNIWVESTPGKGSTFLFTAPAAE